MQYVQISENMTLTDLTVLVGRQNVDAVLAANGLTRTVAIGKQFADKCKAAREADISVTTSQKMSVLNRMTASADVFEKAALSDESDWKVLSMLGTFPQFLQVPEELTLPTSAATLGQDIVIDKLTYNAVRSSLIECGKVDPSVFATYQYIPPYAGDQAHATSSSSSNTDPFQMFNLPWGEIVLHSSIDDDSIDFPVYPEEYSDGVSANYNTMPDLLYQYEPWYVYNSSGPRENLFTFHFHRDMWTGDHRDGQANRLIRFCEANCYPDYNGSAVNVPISTLYIHGKEVISGVMKSVTTDWSGPIGLDGWYLECTLKITIAEVATQPLNYRTIKNKGLIGW